MTAIQDLEAIRLESQVALDSLKTASERNELGQFATPNSLAVAIMEYLRDSFGIGEHIRFLEPAIGLGSFYSALLRVFGQPDKSVGVEIDEAFLNRSRELWRESNLELLRGDFTKQKPKERFNLLVTNPPYVRHHHLEGEDKAALATWASKRYGIRVSQLSGLYCHFIYKAHEWLEDDAISVWLIPSEFMDVNYGEALKQYLCQHVTLELIHRFNPADVQFTDALVSSAIVVFRNRKPSSSHKARMTFGGTLAVPAYVEEVPISELEAARKWSVYPHRDKPRLVHTGLVLGNLFTVKRGLATGDNKFFILTKERAAELEIPGEFLRPILPSTRYIPGNVVERDKDGYAKTEPQLALIDCRLPADEVKAKYPKFWAYLESGMWQGVNDTYLCKGRKPWYSQENRQASPLICTYMGRPKEGAAPFRFILNLSDATATNVYLLLYPKPDMVEVMKDAKKAREIVAALNNVGEQAFFSEGRVYGGGLHKMEPKELMRLPLIGEPFDSLIPQPSLL
jgi:predicted RNA methylase